jgi:hypothetical protein
MPDEGTTDALGSEQLRALYEDGRLTWCQRRSKPERLAPAESCTPQECSVVAITSLSRPLSR